MKLTNIRNALATRLQTTPSITSLSPPARAVLPLLTPWGEMDPVVADGNPVSVGQCVARSPDQRLPAVYASLPGIVKKVDSWTFHDGRRGAALVIDASGSEAAQPGSGNPVATDDPQQLAERIAAAGIGEVDPYPWPLAARLASPELAAAVFALSDPPFDRPIETLIINGMDRQPGDCLRMAVIREYSDILLEGIGAAVKVSAASSVVFIHYASQQLPQGLAEGLQQLGIGIRGYQQKYPIALEPVLVPVATGKELAQPGADARREGVAVVDVVALVKIGEALSSGGPAITTLVQVAAADGNRVIRVPVGTTVETILEQVGHQVPGGGKVIVGGLMLGHALPDLRVPVTHQADSIVIQQPSQVHRYRNRACIGCGYCARVCPMNLLPNELGKYCEFGRFDEAERQDLFYCIECGLCAYVCPAGRPMVQLLRYGKQELKEMRQES